MSPAILVALLGAGALGVWFFTRDAQGTPGAPASGGILTGGGYATPNAPAATGGGGGGGGGWTAGHTQSSIGSGVAAAGLFGATAALWASGIGAIAAVGLVIYEIKKNTTLEARIDFSERFGIFGSGRDAYDKLLDVLGFIGRGDLVHTALSIIGRKDDNANQVWMKSVLEALQQALNAGTWNGGLVPAGSRWT